METKKEPTEIRSEIEALFRHIKEYFETRFDIVILNIQDKSSEIISSITVGFLLGMIALFTLLFTSIGVSWYIGERVGQQSVGFFCVSGFYFVVFILLFVFRESWIKIPMINYIIKKITIDEEG